MVVSQKMIVNTIAMVFLFLKKNADMICPRIAPKNDTIRILIELFGVLWKISTPSSNIFCQIAVDIARKAAIGNNNRTYFFIIHPMLGKECFNVCKNGFVSR